MNEDKDEVGVPIPGCATDDTGTPVLSPAQCTSANSLAVNYSPSPKDGTFNEINHGEDIQMKSPMFVNSEDMKKKVREALTKPQYDVKDFYKTTGIWQRIARNSYFENFTLAVIAFNALWMAIDTDNNDAASIMDAQTVFQVAEHLFCVYFTFEWFVRYMSFRRKRDGLKDFWFVFDSALVFMMVAETWVMTVIMIASGGGGSGGGPNTGILRLFRLLRLSRMARMLRSMPELMILIKGMVAAGRSVFFTLVLLLILIYIFAIAFTQLTKDTYSGDTYFKTIPRSMYTLLLSGTFLDNLGAVVDEIGADGIVFAAVFMFFIALSALMVMNMLIGVLCEVVSAVAASEKEEMSVSFVKDKMHDIVEAIDEDGDCQISRKEFKSIMENQEAVEALMEVGVDPVGLVDFADFIFEDDDTDEEKTLSFSEFMDVVLQLRGSNNATVKDMINLNRVIRREFQKLEDKMDLTRKARTSISMRKSVLGSASEGSSPLSPHDGSGRQRVPSLSRVTTSSSYGLSESENPVTCKEPDGDVINKPPTPPTPPPDTRPAAPPPTSHAPPPPSADDLDPSEIALAVQCSKLEAILSAGLTEVRKLQDPSGPLPITNNSFGQSLANTQLQVWATSMEATIQAGLKDLQRIRDMRVPANLW